MKVRAKKDPVLFDGIKCGASNIDNYLIEHENAINTAQTNRLHDTSIFERIYC